ncbi:MAG: hypothetical protein C0467_05300 [Planctomycetaceae bacterium]|nr:hypothetical protein [Planctomycetaceae bacterium]
MLIRFNCPHCGRRYELSPVMARLPLLCKGCGQSFVVPDASTVVPEPPPPPPPVAPSLKKYTPPPPEPEDEPEAEPEFSPVVPQPKVEKPRPKVKPQLPPPPSEDEPAPEPSRKNLLPLVADVAVGLILLAVGVFLGELLAQKSTGQILHEAGTAMKFPPIELIQWMGPPVVIVLVYGLLASKGRSVGGWLRKRRSS